MTKTQKTNQNTEGNMSSGNNIQDYLAATKKSMAEGKGIPQSLIQDYQQRMQNSMLNHLDGILNPQDTKDTPQTNKR